MRRAGKIDANQTAIVSDLEKAGCFVQSLAGLGNGVPDLLVAHRQTWRVLEVKDGSKCKSKRQLTDDQKDWIERASHFGPVFVVNSSEEALAAMGLQARAA